MLSLKICIVEYCLIKISVLINLWCVLISATPAYSTLLLFSLSRFRRFDFVAVVLLLLFCNHAS